MPRTLPPPLAIAVDVDGTLHQGGRLNHELVAEIRRRKLAGYEVILWSMRGQAYAHRCAIELGILELFDAVISKPGVIYDDEGKAWLDQVEAPPVPGI